MVKSSGSGAYLQTLDRSSRAWVLSTGKSQAADEASSRLGLLPNCFTELRQRTEGENNIWYNPIPEEEDVLRGIGVDSENPWRRRETEGLSETLRDPQMRSQRRAGLVVSPGTSGGGGASRLERHATQNQCPSGGSSPGRAHRTKAITLDSSACSRRDGDGDGPAVIQQIQCEELQSFTAAGAEGGVSSAGGGLSVPSDSPGAQKKGGVASSMMDRIKSPGTVRKSLSMKMRKLPELRRKLSLRSSRSHRHGKEGTGRGGGDGGGEGTSPPNVRKEQSNEVISRYHLDTSAPARPQRRSSRGRSFAASKGGYLSDGDSPELLPKQGRGGPGGPPSAHNTPPPPPHSTHHSSQEGVTMTSDLSSFRVYSVSDQPRCAQRVSGLLTVHLVGVEKLLRSPKQDASKEVFCAIQVDGVTRARTGLLTSRGGSLPLNHTFNLELERARQLKLVVLTPSPGAGAGAETSTTKGSDSTAPTRNRVCCLGAVSIPPLFKASRSQQICVRLEPRGLLYVKLTLLEQWEPPDPRPCHLNPPMVFGVELRHLVDKENSAVHVPLLIQKSVAEIQKRGLKVVGLYRLCGSAAVKKELRDAFERDSAAVSLNEDLYPDINVITGILKDYLRELPSPLITRTLYEVVLEAMSLRPPPPPRSSPGTSSPGRSEADGLRSQSTVALLQCLPEPERATLSLLLDHLSLVASYSDCNRMNCQNLAVCFGPVLLTPTQESWRPTAPGQGGQGGHGGSSGRGGRSFAHSEEIASAVDFKRHIEALHYLLQLWPIPTGDDPDSPTLLQPSSGSDVPPSPPSAMPHNPLPRRCQRGLSLRLDLPDEVGVVSRRGRGRLESPPCNRYAGDWSVCGRDFLSGGEADYDEVAGSDSDEEEEDREEKTAEWTQYVEDLVLDFDAPFTCRLSLKDFDTLISDLERELSKQIKICL
ncbi:LOW QUALITY PROTEIN: rho GTPase-activating protein SYDE1-like [Coregonus clupeaformis]|uniref:LOW QUALITY PROTEIN: rho GTPase-activating protein SYDE1-like n=1 Tax=Coregonus clupeaformis TaxID=59861 RepID=UPI001E1C2C1B|nr:LOW QUALITY PROTEIN: rho GTPase-activating protein SYDE1-like [Coregonus clupeaformis]